MRMQTKLSIVTLVGAGALLLTVLAVVIAPRPQTAYAQSPSTVDNSTVHRRNHATRAANSLHDTPLATCKVSL